MGGDICMRDLGTVKSRYEFTPSCLTLFFVGQLTIICTVITCYGHNHNYCEQTGEWKKILAQKLKMQVSQTS